MQSLISHFETFLFGPFICRI